MIRASTPTDSRNKVSRRLHGTGSEHSSSVNVSDSRSHLFDRYRKHNEKRIVHKQQRAVVSATHSHTRPLARIHITGISLAML